MSSFGPDSSGLGRLLLGAGAFLLMALVGLEWIEGGFIRGKRVEQGERDLTYLIADMKSQQADMKVQAALAEKQVDEISRKRLALKAEHAMGGNLELVTTETEVLRMQVAAAERELQKTEEELVSYRREIRGRLWTTYLGRELTQRDIQGSLPYEEMIITRVDPSGVMVRHRGGAAKVEVKELTPAFREALDLSLMEARKLAKQVAVRKPAERVGPQVGSQERPGVSELVKRLAAGRARCVELQGLIEKADQAAAEARRAELRSKSRSVPGSLETWVGRAVRMEKAALKYRNQLAEVRQAILVLEAEVLRR